MTILRKASPDEFDSPVERLLASLTNLRQQPSGKGAHFYRTSLRRFQAWSSIFQPKIDSQQNEALDFLDNLRRITGKLRDSEVHLELVDRLNNAPGGEKKTLLKALKRRRNKFHKKLKSLLRDPMLRDIWRALRALDESPKRTEPTIARPVSGLHKLALDQYRAFVQRNGVISPKNMHEYRLECKRFRYTAELSGQNREAEELVQGWKSVQGAIGEWHDYLTLSRLANKVLGDSSVHAAVVALADQKYAAARDVVQALERKWVARRKPVPKKRPGNVAMARTLRTA